MWGTRIGAVLMEDNDPVATFEYDPAFVPSGIEVAPIVMPAAEFPYRFPTLAHETFVGLPGLLADSLPDRFGNAVMDAWLAARGRTAASFNAVERLCYVGTRGMGALEYRPATGPETADSDPLDVAALVDLASAILTERDALDTSFGDDERPDAVTEILRIGTSAGGARAKALIAWNPATDEVRSGQLPPGPGFEQWILKFDGVSGNRDRDVADPLGYGLIELAYARMAAAAGITMSECRILREGPRHHFMTRRFDRTPDGDRLHMQSLGAIAHLDFNQPGAAGYEQAMQVIRDLGLPMDAIVEQYRRMVFNVMARNQDDHVKNIAFLMDRTGRWSLSPAFDVTYAYRPDSPWTGRHQMSVNGKREDIGIDDLRAVARAASMSRADTLHVVDEVRDAVAAWPGFAADAGVDDDRAEAIGRTHRLMAAG